MVSCSGTLRMVCWEAEDCSQLLAVYNSSSAPTSVGNHGSPSLRAIPYAIAGDPRCDSRRPDVSNPVAFRFKRVRVNVCGDVDTASAPASGGEAAVP